MARSSKCQVRSDQAKPKQILEVPGVRAGILQFLELNLNGGLHALHPGDILKVSLRRVQVLLETLGVHGPEQLLRLNHTPGLPTAGLNLGEDERGTKIEDRSRTAKRPKPFGTGAVTVMLPDMSTAKTMTGAAASTSAAEGAGARRYS